MSSDIIGRTSITQIEATTDTDSVVSCSMVSQALKLGIFYLALIAPEAARPP
jgi:hypothetical protein